MNITIIGFGEAGPVFAHALQSAGHSVTAFDRLQLDASSAAAQVEKTDNLGITAAPSVTQAVSNAELVLSTVTASEAVAAATQAAPGLQSGAHWLDLNSVSPNTKAAVRNQVEERGAGFTEAVAMDTVPAKGVQVPLLFCGPHARHWADVLNSCGFNCKAISEQYGTASTTKLLRSVMIKGMEALFAESIEAASKAGVQQSVIDSLQATYPELDWYKLAGYQLSRASIHAERRAAEMQEAASVVASMGVQPHMAEATVSRMQYLADKRLAENYNGERIEDFIDALQRNSAST